MNFKLSVLAQLNLFTNHMQKKMGPNQKNIHHNRLYFFYNRIFRIHVAAEKMQLAIHCTPSHANPLLLQVDGCM